MDKFTDEEKIDITKHSIELASTTLAALLQHLEKDEEIKEKSGAFKNALLNATAGILLLQTTQICIKTENIGEYLEHLYAKTKLFFQVEYEQ